MDKIEIGKMYTISFESLSTIYRAKLLYIPNATGDTWRFEVDGKEIAIGYFAKLEPSVEIN